MRFLPAVLALLLACSALVQAQEGAPAGNAVRNPNFDETYDAPNLWNGVNFDGILAPPTAFLLFLSNQGNIARQQMPSGVAVADLNAVGNPDILSTDALGYEILTPRSLLLASSHPCLRCRTLLTSVMPTSSWRAVVQSFLV